MFMILLFLYAVAQTSVEYFEKRQTGESVSLSTEYDSSIITVKVHLLRDTAVWTSNNSKSVKQ